MLPSLQFSLHSGLHVPDEEQCVRLWDKYGMMPNIRRHCRAVAGIAIEIARRAEEKRLVPEGRALDTRYALAGGLLHDIAKTYTIRNGGSHAQLGAAWVQEETGNPVIAQAVMYHVAWPWTGCKGLDDVADPLRLPIIVAYADKRVRHDEIVTLKERFDDLAERYGVNEEKKLSLQKYLQHTQKVEAAIFRLVGEI